MKSIDKLRNRLYNSTLSSHTQHVLETLVDDVEDEFFELFDFCKRVEKVAKHRQPLDVFGVQYEAVPVDCEGIPIFPGDMMLDPAVMDEYKQVLAISRNIWVDEDGVKHRAENSQHVDCSAYSNDNYYLLQDVELQNGEVTAVRYQNTWYERVKD